MTSNWTYGRCDVAAIEVAAQCGAAGRSLAGHFHSQIQVVSVRRGWRRFLTPMGELIAGQGDLLVIPAGMFHTPMGCVGSSTFNLYLDADDPTLSDIKVPMLLHGVQALHPEEIIDTVRSSSRGPSLPMSNDAQEMQRLLTTTDYSVAELADRLGYSPDGFIRIFKRAVGATPGQYRRAHWLTEARRRIRGGASLADAAFAATFADQSHLGRHFLRAYGATPGGYRAAFQPGRRSISFQTRVDG